MTKPRMFSFLIWCLTGIVAATLFFRIPTVIGHAPVTLSSPSNATFRQTDVVQLFTPSHSVAVPTPSSSSFNLLGIIYASPPSASKILVQSGSEVPKKYMQHDTLPNQGVITKIEKKWFEYSLNHHSHTVHLPDSSAKLAPQAL